MDKVHLAKNNSLDNKTTFCQCGLAMYSWDVEYYETASIKKITCENCKRSARYKELKELDETMSEIKTEAEIDFKETKSETSTTDKIESVLSHLDGKLNSKQYVHVFNTLKSFDDGYAFDCANSFHRAITGEFIND